MQCYVNHRFERDKNDYDPIFIDSPTFSNSRKFEGVFDAQRDHGHLIRLAMRRLQLPSFILEKTYIGNSDYTAYCFFYAFEVFSFLLPFAVTCD
ncbi:hypothetical protein [Endozoicomonas euniceicola]|uniref:Transposase DDE domain-containing protein n=1 Tax=Endozoicomonas euniceicola TaxID=1234143 RepID=A0ABY6GVA8_9GAMM|nr:hypothetical protein [Endozoicomonas euniceicola]UYM16707.1 hypothetical protein NX720_01875 [Endozoicomonas euniceicola]